MVRGYNHQTRTSQVPWSQGRDMADQADHPGTMWLRQGPNCCCPLSCGHQGQMLGTATDFMNVRDRDSQVPTLRPLLPPHPCAGSAAERSCGLHSALENFIRVWALRPW